MREGKLGMVRRRIMNVLLLFACMAALLAGCNQKNVQFQDPLVERCVREILGKSAEDPITAVECASIKELKIDCVKGTGLTYHHLKLVFERGNYLDLSDLKYLTGLTTLEIYNEPLYDQLFNVDAIANCEKLETLALDYTPVASDYYIPWIYTVKDIEQVVAKLPNLKEFKMQAMLHEEFQNWILEASGGKEITFTEENLVEDHLLYRNIWPDHKQGAYDLSEYDEIPQDIEDLLLICRAGDEVDFEIFRTFENLKTLTVYSIDAAYGPKDDPLPEDGLAKIKNVDALQENKGFYSLNLCGMTGDFSGIGRLTQLKELSIVMSRVVNSTFIDRLSELRELTFRSNLSEDFSENLKNAGKNLRWLHYLCVNPYDLSDGEWLSDLQSLDALQLGAVSSYLFGEKSDPTGRIVEELKNCKKLKYFCAWGVRKEGSLDLTPLAEVPNLQYVYVTDGMAEIRGTSELLEKKGMRSLVLRGKNMTNDEDVKWMKLGAENESLGRLLIDGMIISNYGYDNWVKMLGEEGARAFIKERQSAFKKCFANHLLCGGYDALISPGRSVEDVESLINQ